MSLCNAWITEQDLTDCKLCEIGSVSQPQAEQILMIASEILYLKTGQQFPGQCEDTVRPCNCSCGPVMGYWAGPWPMKFGAEWRNVCGTCHGYCGVWGQAILLPKRPVTSIISVTVDGLPFTDFRLDSPGWLVRTDGSSWPTCQDITRDSTESGTWQVSYLWGKVPPEGPRFAATVLASELVKACAGDPGCRIPAGAVTVSRRGVTYDIDVTDGKTGLYEVDLVIDSFNPEGRKRRARIYSPDDHQFARTSSGS